MESQERETSFLKWKCRHYFTLADLKAINILVKCKLCLYCDKQQLKVVARPQLEANPVSADTEVSEAPPLKTTVARF